MVRESLKKQLKERKPTYKRLEEREISPHLRELLKRSKKTELEGVRVTIFPNPKDNKIYDEDQAEEDEKKQ